jgi:Terminase-like family.
MTNPLESLHIGYKAPPTIARFMASRALFRGLMGPVGSGKSSACSVELMAKAFAQAPNPDGLRRTRFAVVRNTYRELKDTTLRTWLAWFPEEHFGPFAHAEMVHRLNLPQPDGTIVLAEVLFRALDRPQDARKLLSLELTGAWVNEARELPLAVVEALGDRVERYPAHREGGCSWAGVILDTNPPDTDHWWHRLAEETRPEGWAFFRQPGGLVERNGIFEPNPRAENLEHLPRDFYPRRMAGKSARHVRVYYCGRYGAVQDGLPVYPEFDEVRHVAAAPLDPVAGLPLFIGLDFGLTPAAALAQRLPNGRWLLLDELVSQGMGMVRFAALLNELLRERYADLQPEIWGDPAGMARAQTDERTPYDILRTAGLFARPTDTNDPLLRREAVAAALARDIDDCPGLVLSPRCRTLVSGMGGAWRYRRLAVSGEERFADAPEKSRFSHVCEAAQYLFVGAGEGRRLITPQGPQGLQGPGAKRQERSQNPAR